MEFTLTFEIDAETKLQIQIQVGASGSDFSLQDLMDALADLIAGLIAAQADANEGSILDGAAVDGKYGPHIWGHCFCLSASFLMLAVHMKFMYFVFA